MSTPSKIVSRMARVVASLRKQAERDLKSAAATLESLTAMEKELAGGVTDKAEKSKAGASKPAKKAESAKPGKTKAKTSKKSAASESKAEKPAKKTSKSAKKVKAKKSSK